MTSTVLSGAPDEGADHGPGLWQRTYADGSSVFTNLRLAGTTRSRGAGLINFATALLFLLSVGLFAVSFKGQYTYIFAQKHVSTVSAIEALSLDGGMAIFSLLGLGLARAGKSARVERVLILICAAGSAAMNLGAANVASPRSIAAYVAPPIFLAVVVDRVISVIRRHYLGDEEVSPWAVLGHGAAYLARFVLAPRSTAKGVRQLVLNATPVPEPATVAEPAQTIPAVIELPERGPVQARPVRPVAAIEGPRASKPRATASRKPKAKKSSQKQGGSKQSELIRLATEEHGLADKPLSEVSKLATMLSTQVGLHPATGRRVLLAHARSLQDGDA